jgi:hypothetical protein
MAFLEQRCKALELIQTSQASNSTTASSRHTSSVSGNKVGQTSRSYITTRSQCTLCKESHQVYHCPKFLKWSVQQRMDFAHKFKLCYNCLKPFSKDHVCTNQTCKICHKRHHMSLHGANYSQSTDKVSTPSRSVNSNDNSPAETSTYCSFKGRPTSHILLATAIVNVETKFKQRIPCRVLLVSASQLNFISEHCVNRLGLTKHSSSTSIQGVNKVNTSTHHSVSVQLYSRFTDWQSKSNVQCCHTSLTTLLV